MTFVVGIKILYYDSKITLGTSEDSFVDVM